jgi:hypothetical protein
LFDLENHQHVLEKIARVGEANATAIARELRWKQPGFWDMAYALLEAYPSSAKVSAALIGPLDELSGWGYYHQRLNEPLEAISSQLKLDTLTPIARLWLEGAKSTFAARQKHDEQRFGD